MTGLRRILALLILLGVCSLASAADRAPFEVGARVGIKGRFVDGVLLAREIEARQGDRPSMKGTLESWDARSGVAVIGPLRLEASSRVSYQDAAGDDITSADFEAHQRVKIKLSVKQDGSVRIKRIQQLEGIGSLSLRGRVSEILERGQESVRFRLEGWNVDVLATFETKWTELRSPLAFLVPRLEPPGRGFGWGKNAIFGGEVRLDYGERDNSDLADILDNDRATVRLRTELGVFFPGTQRFAAALGLKVSREQAVTDEEHRFDTRDVIELDETWLMLYGLLGRRGSVQIGRVHLEDERQWLYYGETEAVRLFFDWPRFGLEAAFFQKLVDPEDHLKDLRGTLLRAQYKPARRHSVEAWVLDFDDSFRDETAPATDERRGFSPRYYGLSIHGFQKPYLRYWLEATLARGRVGARGTPLRAHAYDVGLTAILPKPWQPSFTLGVAVGSGDDEPNSGVERNFRQTGMHRNSGKWNGVTTFRYYGEFLRPELSNLQVTTLAVGLRPWTRMSVDLVHHRYKLESATSAPPRTAIRGRRLDLQHRSLGEEWDLVIGLEKWEHFELELDLSYFRPGDALLGPRDSAHAVSLKIKYLLGGRR